ncbi:MAG TPA: peptide deformylase [Candidatus Cloacimonadota bacterium]|nr:peptide deformylase [Candidatus Cloacimonadota bacterium]HOQ79430.1 peptide deformylase [Candidatus Cloacimonadota bacterium]
MNRKPKILPIRIYGDKVLSQKAEPVEQITPEIAEFIEDLTHTMYEKDGVGLAAPQVGVSLRIFVVDTKWTTEDKRKPLVFINPEFITMEESETNEEGCLSFPNIFEKVTRFKYVKIKARNEKWEEVIYEGEELFAIALQHEYDHLNGVFFIDKIPQIRKLIIRKQLKELESTTEENGINIRND